MSCRLPIANVHVPLGSEHSRCIDLATAPGLESWGLIHRRGSDTCGFFFFFFFCLASIQSAGMDNKHGGEKPACVILHRLALLTSGQSVNEYQGAKA